MNRRRFLKQSATIVTAALVASQIPIQASEAVAAESDFFVLQGPIETILDGKPVTIKSLKVEQVGVKVGGRVLGT